MRLHVKLYGALAERSSSKKIKLNVNTYRDARGLLEQWVPLNEFLQIHPCEFRIGPALNKSFPLTAEQFVTWEVQQETTLHIVPRVSGHAISGAALLTAVLTSIASIAISLLLSALMPTATTKDDKRKSVLYQNGLNTQQEGVPLPVIAGKRVFCGFNVIEADVDVTNYGGTKTSSTPSGWAAMAIVGGEVAKYLSEADSIAKTVSGSKGGGGKTISNTTFSDAILKFRAAIGAGEIGGILGDTIQDKETNILVNEVPLRDSGTGNLNYSGISWGERFGVEGQSPDPTTPGVCNNFDQNLQLKQKNAGGSQIYVTETVSSPDVDTVKLRFQYPALIHTSKKGNQSETSVAVGAQTKRASDTTWTSAGTWTTYEKSSAPFQREYQITAPPGAGDDTDPWLFRVYRITADSTDDKTQNETYFDGWVEIQNLKLTYDGSGGEVPTALFSASIDLSQFDNGNYPEIALICQGQKVRVPDNYDPDTLVYTGNWEGDFKYAITENPVWHWFDQATNKQTGCGIPDSFFSLQELYQCAQYCDEQVNGRTRFTLNKQFTDEVDGWQGLTDLAQTFRATPFFGGSQVMLVQDRPKPAVDHFVNNAMIQDGQFSYTSTQIQDRLNECIVQYDNMDDYGRTAQVKYQDTDSIAQNRAMGLSNNGIVTKTVYKIGCTNRQEAYDWARILVFASQNEFETIQWTTSITGATYLPGQLIDVIDWNLNGQECVGRISSVASNQVVLDVPMFAEVGHTYQALCYPTDYAMDIRPVGGVTTSGETNTFTMDTTGLEADTPIAIVDTATGSVHPRTFRIQSITEEDEGTYTVSAQLYVDGKFAWLDDNVPVTSDTWTSINTAAPKPTGLTITENSYVDDLLGPSHELNVSWDAMNKPPSGAFNPNSIPKINGYLVEVMRPNTTVWEQIYKGNTTTCTILRCDPGKHVVSVRTLNTMNRTGAAALETYTIVNGESGATVYPPVFVSLD